MVGTNPEAVVRYTSQDHSSRKHSWRKTTDGRAVTREVVGLLNLWAGFPPFRDANTLLHAFRYTRSGALRTRPCQP
jgi:hypothetical protein